VDFDYMSRREIIKVAKNAGMESAVVDVENNPSSPTLLPPTGRGIDGEGEFEERWTGSYIFENEW